MYETLKSMMSGDQGRTFDKTTYENLIKQDASLADDFMQIGDKFYYLGDSMEELEKTIK
jgi:hypothetical protein